ncbi:unnamed protein product [Musa acuminata subsp. burmannicoides]
MTPSPPHGVTPKACTVKAVRGGLLACTHLLGARDPEPTVRQLAPASIQRLASTVVGRHGWRAGGRVWGRGRRRRRIVRDELRRTHSGHTATATRRTRVCALLFGSILGLWWESIERGIYAEGCASECDGLLSGWDGSKSDGICCLVQLRLQ